MSIAGVASKVVAAVLLLAGAAACDDAGGSSAVAGATTVPTSVPESSVPDGSVPDGSATDSSDSPEPTQPPGRADGVLRIGTLLPLTGPGNEIGLAGTNAVNVGVTEINERGGVLGQDVQLLSESEGESVADARVGIRRLLDGGVDAIIGPASSLVAMETLDELMAAGVLVCSPTANALALNEYPDRELFFRSVPSDSLTAQAMAEVALNTGVDDFAVVYLDDEFGRPFAEQAMGRLAGRGVEVYDRPFSSDVTQDELAVFVSELAELAPRTILLIGDSETGWAMMQALSGAFVTEPPSIIVNDAMRQPPSTDVVAGLPAEFRSGIQGVSPVVPPEPPEPAGVYATNVLDCLNLIALSAVQAGTDDPAAIADEMVNASVAGQGCSSFASCVVIAEDDRTFNYQGPNSIDITSRGDPARGRFGIFTFDASGLDVPSGQVAITEITE